MISCPACAGVVRAELGPHHHMGFVCSVGHAFSLEELYVAKEEQLEYVQWSLVALLTHLEMILQMISGPDQDGFQPHGLQQRQEQLAHHMTLVKHLIAETQLASLDEITGNERTGRGHA